MAGENSARLAVLIDADNAQPAVVEGLLAEVAKYGTAHVKRAYGDWTGTSLKGWKDQLLAQSIQPIQQFAYTTGKNATDAAMVIDAMDLLYSGRFDGFCLVSPLTELTAGFAQVNGGSDFTRLAARLRESGLTVYGFGERKTPKPFVAACDKFIYIENLGYADSPTAQTGATLKPKPAISAAQLKANTALVNQLRSAIDAASDDDGWASLAAVGNILISNAQTSTRAPTATPSSASCWPRPCCSSWIAAAPAMANRRSSTHVTSDVVWARRHRPPRGTGESTMTRPVMSQRHHRDEPGRTHLTSPTRDAVIAAVEQGVAFCPSHPTQAAR